MLDILQDIHRFCEGNGLKYYLAYGTLLGAVRHGGFIPWDDDIDIWMPRPDYERMKKEYNHAYYKVLTAETDKHYPLDFMKIHDSRTVVEEDGGDGNWGIFVDVFPLDGTPGEKQWKKTCKKINFMRHLIANQRFTRHYTLSKKHRFKKNVSIAIGKILHPFLSLNQLLMKEDVILKSFSIETCSFICDFTDLHPILLKKGFLDYPILLSFEGSYFYAPKDYNGWLTLIFGDYMTPPPPEKCISNHNIRAFWV